MWLWGTLLRYVSFKCPASIALARSTDVSSWRDILKSTVSHVMMGPGYLSQLCPVFLYSSVFTHVTHNTTIRNCLSKISAWIEHGLIWPKLFYLAFKVPEWKDKCPLLTPVPSDENKRPQQYDLGHLFSPWLNWGKKWLQKVLTFSPGFSTSVRPISISRGLLAIRPV